MRIQLVLIVLFAFAFVHFVVQSKTIQWVGKAGDNSWESKENWDSNLVPSSEDDAIITNTNKVTIFIHDPARVNSIVLGGNVLNVLNPLSVGKGGVKAYQGASLTFNAGIDDLFSSEGTVSFTTNSFFIFISGTIQGTGEFVVDTSSVLRFDDASTKKINGTSLASYGPTVIQPTTILIENQGSLTLSGLVESSGFITFASTDKTGTLFSSGNFTYAYGALNQPLTFLLTTTFRGNLNVNLGALAIQAAFSTNSTLLLGNGTKLLILGFTDIHTFTSISGAGSTIYIGAPAEFAGSVSASQIQVDEVGNALFHGGVKVSDLLVSGKVSVDETLYTDNLFLNAGILTGSGTFQTNYFELGFSFAGNNSFISSQVWVQSKASVSFSHVYLYLGTNGNLQISNGATLLVSSDFAYLDHDSNGYGLITVLGTISVTGTLNSNVNYAGSGVITVSGNLHFASNHVDNLSFQITKTASVFFDNTILKLKQIQGDGSVNVSSSAATQSLLGNVQITNLFVFGGPTAANSLKLSGILEIGFGELALLSDSSADTFLFLGGTLSSTSEVSFSARSIVLQSNLLKTISSVLVTGKLLSSSCPVSGVCALDIINGGSFSIN